MSSPVVSLSRSLTNLDQFRTVSRDIARGTVFGGTFTAIAYALLLLLLIAELGAFLRTSYSTNVQLDDKVEEAIAIEFDVTLFDLPCKYLQVGVWDKFGKERIIGHEKLVYLPLNYDGQVKGMSYTKEEIAILERTDTQMDVSEEEKKELDADWSSSSDHFKHHDFDRAVTYHDFTVVNFYAEWCSHCRQFHPTWMQATEKISDKMMFTDADGQQTTVKFLKMNCVDFKDTCQNGKIAAFPTIRLYKRDGSFEVFQQKRSVDNLISFLTQSVRNSHYIVAHHHALFNEGCQVKGSLSVPRVQGYFHLQAEPFGSVNLNPALTNVSHQVNHLSFGAADLGWTVKEQTRMLKREKVPDEITSNISPLDGRKFIVERFHQAPEHYLKVVGTKVKGWKTVYQITHTDRTRKLGATDAQTVPQARFAYDFSPLSVVVKLNSKRWYEFLTSLFAILGGTFTVVELCSGAVDSVHHTVKEALGKDN